MQDWTSAAVTRVTIGVVIDASWPEEIQVKSYMRAESVAAYSVANSA